MTEKKTDTYETLEFWLGDDWKKISDEHKRILADKLDSLTDTNFETTKGLFERIRDRREIQGVLILGVVLGILGNLVANYLDRYFLRFGFAYSLVVSVGFIVVYIILNRAFDKGISSMVRSNPTLRAMIVEKTEKK